MLPRHLPLPAKEFRDVSGVLVQRDTQDLEPLGVQAVERRMEIGHVADTGTAPRRPEIEQIDLPEQRLAGEALSRIHQPGEMKARHGNADADHAIGRVLRPQKRQHRRVRVLRHEPDEIIVATRHLLHAHGKLHRVAQCVALHAPVWVSFRHGVEIREREVYGGAVLQQVLPRATRVACEFVGGEHQKRGLQRPDWRLRAYCVHDSGQQPRISRRPDLCETYLAQQKLVFDQRIPIAFDAAFKLSQSRCPVEPEGIFARVRRGGRIVVSTGDLINKSPRIGKASRK